MARGNQNSAYKERNLEFLEEYASRDGVKVLFNGVMYREITKGKGDKPTPKAMITVHYTGKLINGKVFDNSWERGYPEAFRLSDLIVGWQIALTQMHVGDHWMVYIPYEVGYGTRDNGPIPAYSTLIFEVKLVAIM